MVKSKLKLKSALQSQQTRFKAKEKAVRLAEAAEQKLKARQGGGKSKKSKGKEARPTNPFKTTDKILLIGEGDFSFTRALLASGTPPGNVTATTIDSEEECLAKYPYTAPEILPYIKEQGVEVVFGVDGTRLDAVGEEHKRWRGGKGKGREERRWDRVVWNFPHSGSGEKDLERGVRGNQEMVLGFLRGVRGLLREGKAPVLGGKRRKQEDNDEEQEQEEQEEESSRGTVLITLRNVIPYTLWDVPNLAKKPPPPNPRYVLFRSFVFHRDIWEGYEHRMTKGDRAHGTGKTGEGGEDRTWEFYLRDD